MRRFAIASLLFVVAQIAGDVAHAAESESYTRGRIVDGMTCLSDPTQSYAYYLPSNYTPEHRWPLLFVFDPRRRGASAAEMFREPAEKYGWIIVSSNNTISDTDWAPNLKALRATWPDAQKRFTIDPRRIYATGFSGGAMLAWWLARTTNGLAGVISCSGRLGDPADAAAVNFDWFGTAGDIDFNYNETRKIDTKLMAIHANHRVELFPGGHQWAPRPLLAQAIDWMELQAMRRGTRPRDEKLIATLMQQDLAGVDPDHELAALHRLEAITRTFEGLAPVDDVNRRIAELRTRKSVLRALDEERRGDALEASYRVRMAQAFSDFRGADEPQPATVLAHNLDLPVLHKLAEEKSYRGTTAQRVLETEYSQLAGELARRFAELKEYGSEVTVLTVARDIHPERNTLIYDLACAQALAGRKRDALASLEQAVSLGFNDAKQMAVDSDLDSIRGDQRFREIAARVR